jgi:hypothetical protein
MRFSATKALQSLQYKPDTCKALPDLHVSSTPASQQKLAPFQPHDLSKLVLEDERPF